MSEMIASDHYDLILTLRILGGGAPTGRMAVYKYVSNRCLTLVENVLLGAKLGEYCTGFQAFFRDLLRSLSSGGRFRRLRIQK